ncbi:MAG: DUF1553 domain-containing protein [Pirellulaceae bacterium]
MLGVLTLPRLGTAQDETAVASSEDENSFHQAAAPYLARFCVSCHEAGDPAGGLDLSRESGWRAGGDSGEPTESVAKLDPGQRFPRAVSTLIGQRIFTHEMPPEDAAEQPTDDQTARFLAWLEAGGEWPADARVDPGAVTTESRAGRDWWSLQPLKQAPTPRLDTALEGPTANRSHSLAGPIDAWLETARRQRGLIANPLASRRTLLIRASLDLIGLAPTLEEVERFERQTRPDAWEREIDRLLASPQFGPRWGRHWLDVARYGDTHGYERDFPRAHAWRYRDWVIDAVNRDLPFDQFVVDQVAGDVHANASDETVLGTGFLSSGPYDVTGLAETPSPVLQRMARAEELDDMVSTTANAFLGLTLQCARCHSHKVDPITQLDYYQFTALLSGVHRGDVAALPASERARRERQRDELRGRLAEIESELGELRQRVDLAQVIAGGDGRSIQSNEFGVDPRSGSFEPGKVAMLEEAVVNQFVQGVSRYIDGVLIPDGGSVEAGKVTISSTGLQAEVRDTSGLSWDYFHSGPVQSQAFTTLGDVDYAEEGHSLLGMHANKVITFDLRALRRGDDRPWSFRAVLGYGGQELETRADFVVLVDGQEAFARREFTRSDGAIPCEVNLPAQARFLTLIATDGGDGIGHDQVFLGDPWLAAESEGEARERADQLHAERADIQARLDAMGETPWMYGLVIREPRPVHVALRGDPELLGEAAEPGLLSCLPFSGTPLTDDSSDAQRRLTLATWLGDDAGFLVARVAVNRMWHYHFGTGLVGTPSDFGFNGDRPTHPELLDALAGELIDSGWSSKWLHRKMLISAAWRQSAAHSEAQAGIDHDNRWLWRYSPQRLEAEAIRDRVLQTAGTLQWNMSGPGFRDFEFIERYAPIYRHRSTDSPEFWRRSIYRFAVRSVPEPLMEALDCPNPTTAAPQRNETTTAVQALAMLNGEFLLQQADRFAERLEAEFPDSPSAQVEAAFRAAFVRAPTDDELSWGTSFLERAGLRSLCRALLNANEFLYVE